MDRSNTDSTFVETHVSYELEGAELKAKTCAKPIQVSRLWVAYEHHGCYFLDIVQTSGTPEDRRKDIRAWWESRVPRLYRATQRIFSCKRPVIMIGRLPPVARLNTVGSKRTDRCQMPRDLLQERQLPHETQFLSIEMNDILTRGFRNPASLGDDPELLNRIADLQEYGDSTTQALERKERTVIVVGWEVDKALLAYPFFGTLIITTIFAVAVGISTKCIATGAQVGECLCGMVATVFCYVVWRCN